MKRKITQLFTISIFSMCRQGFNVLRNSRTPPAPNANTHGHCFRLQGPNAVWFVTGGRPQCISARLACRKSTEGEDIKTETRVRKPSPRSDILVVNLPDLLKCSDVSGNASLCDLTFCNFPLRSNHLRRVVRPGVNRPHVNLRLQYMYIHLGQPGFAARLI